MIDVQDLIALLGADESDADTLAELERNAVAFVESQTGRYFGDPEPFEEVLRSTGARSLWLRDHVIEDSDNAVTLEQRPHPGGTATVLSFGQEYLMRQYDREQALVKTGGDGWDPNHEYTALYTRGWEPGEEPGEIRQLVIDLVTYRWGLRESLGLASETIGGYSYTRGAIHAFQDGDLRLIPGALRVIAAWQRPVWS